MDNFNSQSVVSMHSRIAGVFMIVIISLLVVR